MAPGDANSSAPLPVRYEFVSDPEAVHSILQRAMDDLEKSKSSKDDKDNVKIVMAEVINNIIEHAYQFERNQPVEITLTRSGEYLEISFVDKGRPMPPVRIPPEGPNNIHCNPEDLPEGGFGWQIIRNLAESISYSRTGGKNILKLELKLTDQT